MKGIRGYKVVNYSEWCNIPDIFTNQKDAEKARDKWEYKNGSVIELIDSRKRRARVVVR